MQKVEGLLCHYFFVYFFDWCVCVEGHEEVLNRVPMPSQGAAHVL